MPNSIQKHPERHYWWLVLTDTLTNMLPGISRKRKMRSKVWWFTGFCNSHYVSHFAAFFIVVGAKTSIAESCIDFYLCVLTVPPFSPRRKTGRLQKLFTFQISVKPSFRRKTHIFCTEFSFWKIKYGYIQTVSQVCTPPSFLHKERHRTSCQRQTVNETFPPPHLSMRRRSVESEERKKRFFVLW